VYLSQLFRSFADCSLPWQHDAGVSSRPVTTNVDKHQGSSLLKLFSMYCSIKLVLFIVIFLFFYSTLCFLDFKFFCIILLFCGVRFFFKIIYLFSCNFYRMSIHSSMFITNLFQLVLHAQLTLQVCLKQNNARQSECNSSAVQKTAVQIICILRDW